MFIESINLKHAVCPISPVVLTSFFTRKNANMAKVFEIHYYGRHCIDTLNKIIYKIERVRGENKLEDEDVFLCWFSGDKFMEKFGTNQTYGLSFGYLMKCTTGVYLTQYQNIQSSHGLWWKPFGIMRQAKNGVQKTYEHVLYAKNKLINHLFSHMSFRRKK